MYYETVSTEVVPHPSLREERDQWSPRCDRWEASRLASPTAVDCRTLDDSGSQGHSWMYFSTVSLYNSSHGWKTSPVDKNAPDFSRKHVTQLLFSTDRHHHLSFILSNRNRDCPLALLGHDTRRRPHGHNVPLERPPPRRQFRTIIGGDIAHAFCRG